ncbi:MAG TPA: ATP synthase F1 subunit delta [Armatimonadota bacterium]
MRPPSRVARRYAAAIFNAARRANAIPDVEQDLNDVRAMLEQYPEVLKALLAPRVPIERKTAVLDALISARLRHDLSRRFLVLMVNHGREGELPAAAAAFATLADQANNVVTASVRSAAALDDGQTQRLKAKLDGLTGKNTRLEVSTDPDLVGGLVVRIGDTVMDGSVRGYLEQIARKLSAAPLGQIALDSIPG